MLEILDFYADWCHPCQIMKPIFEELEKELKGKVKFTIIDVDKNPEKSEKYNVLSIPTYIIMKDGKEIDRFSGVTPKQKFISIVNSNS